MSFDAFMETAWNDHGDRPQEVADRLAGSLQVIAAAEQIPLFARLLTHVYGEHLGQWREGIALLESLRSLPAFDGSPPVTGALARSVGVLRYASGDSEALKPLSLEDRVSVLATVSSALAARSEFTRAISAYSEALRLADSGLSIGSPAIRALAVGGNNLASSLELKKDRNASETAGMIIAAEGGLKYWKQAGTWLEEERAEFRLARSLLQAGKPDTAIESARRCVEVCLANGAPAFEQFFGYAVLALAQRAAADVTGFAASAERARQLYELVPEAERQWCQSDLRLAKPSDTARGHNAGYSRPFAFVASGVLLNITPGPDMLYVVARSTAQGARAGAVAALGIAAGCGVLMAAAAFGLSAVIAASATAFSLLKVLGAIYLVYVGVSLMLASRSSPEDAGGRPGARRSARDIHPGFPDQRAESKGGAVLSGAPAAVHRPRCTRQATRIPLSGRHFQFDKHVVESAGRLVRGTLQQRFRSHAARRLAQSLHWRGLRLFGHQDCIRETGLSRRVANIAGWPA